MKKIIVLLTLAVAPAIWCQWAVHDSVSYIHNTVKAIQDELYQQLDLDFQMDQLGKTGEILRTGVETLKVTKDTYNTVTDVYDTAMGIYNNIGDPVKLVNYMNSRFWHEHEIQAALNITREAMDMANSKVANTGNIESMLRQVDYASREIDIRRSENLAETQKGAIAVRKFMSEWGPKAMLQLTDLNREDQKYNPRNSNLVEMQYATYRNGIWQSNTLGQMFAAQSMHSAMVAQQMYMENLRQDEEDLKRAQSIYDGQIFSAEGARILESKGSVSNNFVDTFIYGR